MTADETDSAETVSAPDDPSAVEQLAELHESLAWLPGLGRLIYDAMIESSFEARERVGRCYSVLANLRLVRFNEMEYTVPAEAGPDCLREILSAIERLPRPASWPLEYRYIRADDVWLSPFYQRDGCSISLHQPIARDYRPFFDTVEPIFWKYQGRPHWGKLHSLDGAQLAGLYPRWADFQDVRREVDPDGRFLNPHLRRVFGVPS
jgi:FAD/FMN-containing dehydrogenase